MDNRERLINEVGMRLGYADPPYPGQAKRHYGDHPDYAGEVDHAALVHRLMDEFDGWVLHTSSPAISIVAPLVGGVEGVRWAAWVKSMCSFKPGVRPHYAWEPVVFKPLRRPEANFSPAGVIRDWIDCPLTLRGGFVGAKPEAVCHWAFEIVGAQRGDVMVDIFPGSGAVGRAWESWRPQLELAV